jgi:hypothetical protein
VAKSKRKIVVTYTIPVPEDRKLKDIRAAAKGEAYYVAESISGDTTTKAKVEVREA